MARWEVDQGRLRGLYHLTCDTCDTCTRAHSDFIAAPNGYENWPVCPVKLLKTPAWQYLIKLHNAHHVSPLSPWPQGRAAWVVLGMTELVLQMDRHEAAKREKKTGGKGGPRVPV